MNILVAFRIVGTLCVRKNAQKCQFLCAIKTAIHHAGISCFPFQRDLHCQVGTRFSTMGALNSCGSTKSQQTYLHMQDLHFSTVTDCIPVQSIDVNGFGFHNYLMRLWAGVSLVESEARIKHPSQFSWICIKALFCSFILTSAHLLQGKDAFDMDSALRNKSLKFHLPRWSNIYQP